MKKLVSVLLAAAMVVSISGCSKETEETKKKEKETKETTESVTEEPTETEPTESETDPTSDTSETSDTDADPTTDTTPSTKPGNGLPEYLDGSFETEIHVYAAEDKGNPKSRGVYVEENKTLFVFNGDDTSPLAQSLDSIMKDKIEMTDSLYETMVGIFESDVASGKVPTGESFDLTTVPFRMDEQILSFAVTKSPDLVAGQVQGVNIEATSGKILSLDNVITDKQEFQDYVQVILPYTDLTCDDDEVMGLVKSGTVEFALTYNAMVLLLPYGDGEDPMTNTIWLPYLGNEVFLNPAYFMTAPEEYVLFPDWGHSVDWDVDDDGSEEMILPLGMTDDYDMALSFMIFYDMTDYDSSRDLPDIYGEMESFCVMKTNNGVFLYCMVNDEGAHSTYIFKLEDGEVTYEGNFMGWIDGEAFVDPHNFTISTPCMLLGQEVMLRDTYIGVDTNGQPIHSGDTFSSTCAYPYVCKAELAGTQVDADLSTKMGEVTIPMDSSFVVLQILPNSLEVLVKVAAADVSEEYYVLLPISSDLGSGTEKLCGKAQSEVLYGA